MRHTRPDENTVNELARETGLGRLYTTGGDADGTKWTLTVPQVVVYDRDGGAAWMVVYLTELAIRLGRGHLISDASREATRGVVFASGYREPDEQAAVDAEKPLTRTRAGI